MCRHDPNCSGPDSDDPVAVEAWLDQSDAWLRETIRRYGWAVQAVFGNDERRRPPLSYTVGLWGFGHPELVVFGIHERHAQTLLNELGERVRAGEVLQAGDEVVSQLLRPNPQLRLLPLPNAADVTLDVQRTYGTPGGQAIPALQVCWADIDGTYPWEPGFRYPRWLQPMPGTYAA
jgi:hypothetical protein